MTEETSEKDKPKQACVTCRFWEDLFSATCKEYRSSIDDGYDDPSGCCHRYPPSIRCGENSNFIGPCVWADDWCGEWQPAEDKAEPATVVANFHQLLHDGDAARLIGMPRSRLVRLAKHGKAPCIILPDGEIRFSEDDIRRWVDAHKQPVVGESSLP